MVLEKRKTIMQKSGIKRSLCRLRPRLFHVMLDVILIVCLVIFDVAWLVSNDWDCLMSLWKNYALFLFYGSINLVFSLMLYLGWLGACSHMFDLYKVTISLYDYLVFDFWCYLMLVLMMFCRYVTRVCPSGTGGLVYRVRPIKEVDKNKDSTGWLGVEEGRL
jgi:hypothetical protein